MITITIVRHGESIGNVQQRWQGHTNSPLTNFGAQQAEQAGEALKHERFTSVITSDLIRTISTAELILSRNINFSTNPIELYSEIRLREQHFGYFEDKSNTLPVKYALTPPDRRLIKFVGEGAESLEDVFNRAMSFLSDLLSYYQQQQKINSQQKDFSFHQGHPHILIVSHSIFINEILNALLIHKTILRNQQQWQFIPLHNTSIFTIKIHTFDDHEQEPLHVEIIRNNYIEHLRGLVRQQGGIGSAIYDPKQKKISSFFQKKQQSSIRNDSQNEGLGDPMDED
ncbi:phosphoglycerate mutase-like protein [Rhizophagus irregularis]|uniref:Phosphoglycerate mutase-like protein n=2 Tax=Rhizophagus irregularis TaxID=588596 RepID=A0A2I1E627_9GLOM|nr:histidine phosphatase superfamily [Rhizophagus irregularis DAOM 181602=DAOM 197198]PKC14116.1 phosphoglycerate mutase-like protein [Rhizophagus irregularis]PKC73297.1 phosphoglycerate mutase-like protein [Rhizophagus irregularis]PKK78630.1 phosphoglycerate mutase-like protein [Rhizophagus irregularis]PKY17584.1 phosphoglycerate mutase-like protein [Rhizophagus irregularis]POG69701.1 histidine phosphatase superfamily [Rhizophagus irregularis DAOM 181602=DAOM 197198]|eukprot:XP_025176567.1 histidine phosphatase superfamily [Rhizophagus irregularis DAOM 181602=DAOM 197198]